MPMLRKLWAFYKRDFRIQLTHRLGFSLGLARTFVSLLLFFFIGKMFGGIGSQSHLTAYGGDYFRFVLLGIAASGFMSTALGSLNRTISFERGHGTLEAILLTPTPFPTVALARALWDMTLVIVNVAIYLVLGAVVFRVDLSQANWIAALPTVLLTITTFLGLGMISAGVFLLTRETSLIDFVVGGASRFLAGVYFPIAVLPDWLRQVADWLPLTHTVEAVRKSLILGAPLDAIGQELRMLLGFSAVLFPAGLLFLRWAFDQARSRGSLAFEN